MEEKLIPVASSKGGFKRRRWLIALVAVIAVVVIGSWYSFTRGGELSPQTSGRATALLTQVEAEAGLAVERRSPIERDGPDGPMPEMAARTFVTTVDAVTIRSRIFEACRSLGIAPANAERRAIEPDVLCDGGDRHQGESVHLSLSCDSKCTAHLQTQIVGF